MVDEEGAIRRHVEKEPPLSSTDSEQVDITVDEAIDLIGFGRFQIGVLLICGGIQAADAMEMMLLAVLGPVLECTWKLSAMDIAFLTTIVFIGMMIGSPVLGYCSDRYGRWAVLFISSCAIAYFGILSAVTPSYAWLLLMRFCVGFSVGGLLASSSTLFAEFMPSKYRAKALIVMLTLWSVGALFEVGIAYITLTTIGWRWLLAITAVPLVLILASFMWLPKSPRFLLASGQTAEAMAVLHRVCRTNGAPLLTQRLIHETHKHRMGSVTDLFRRSTAITSVLLFVLWFGCGFTYYGSVLTSTELLRVERPCLQNLSQSFVPSGEALDNSCCSRLTDEVYHTIIIATVGEFINIPWNLVLIDFIGRKGNLVVNFALSCVLFVSLDFCMPNVVAEILLLLLRGFTVAVFGVVYVYTNEYYPTTTRTFGMGICSASARIGAMTTPFVAQVMLPNVSVIGALALYSVVCLACLIGSLLLPVETKGRPMVQTTSELELVDLGKTRNEPRDYRTFDK